ncbi:MAG: xanthine dehydrogenase family protein subunit M [Desulfobacterales bacterium]|nr:MAG: xanthine dehydrogenase family protein subunit M [Desulfobacterales bacterium]
MRIRSFDYWEAPSVDEALTELEVSGEDTKVIAGGTDLVLNMKKKKILPRRLISLHNLKELDFVRTQDSKIHIGALTRHADIAAHPVVKTHLPILGEAVGLIGSWQIRNVGTIGGNICNASPAADSAPPLLVLNAQLIVASKKTEKKIALESFFTGPAETVLETGQILKEIVIELPKQRSAGCYLKLRRRKAVDVSLAGVAFQAETESDGRTLARVGIALGGVAPTPIRVAEAEAVLTGLHVDEALTKISDCAEIAVQAASPIDDVRATASYRRTIVDVFLHQCAQKVLSTLKYGGGN